MMGWGVFGLGGVRGGWLGRKVGVGLGVCGFGWDQIILIVYRQLSKFGLGERMVI